MGRAVKQSYYSREQLLQLVSLSTTLCDLNRAILDPLRRLQYSCVTEGQYRKATESISFFADRITLVVRNLEDLRCLTQKHVPERIVVRVLVRYSDSRDARSDVEGDNQLDTVRAVNDGLWQSVNKLLQAICTAEQRIFARRISRQARLKRIVQTALIPLQRAVRRECSYLQPSDVRQVPNFRVEYLREKETCGNCDKGDSHQMDNVTSSEGGDETH
jgi:hypothetical protein